MIQPPYPWFEEKKFDNPLAEIVSRGDLQKARAYFDSAFWENSREQPTWAHLKIALLRRDVPMMKLLATWGARPSDSEMAQFRTIAEDKYADYLRLLRQAGLRGVNTRWEELPAQPLSKEEAARLPPPEDDIEKIPAEWLRVLKGFRQAGAAEAVIAGGALRDTYNNKPVKDVDIFLRMRGNRKKHKNFMEEAFSAAGVMVVEQSFSDGYGVVRTAFPEPVTQKDSLAAEFNFTRKRQTESWKVIAGPSRTEYNVIFVDDNLDRKLSANALPREQAQLFAGGLLSTFDIALCQIVTDGASVVSTPGYKEDVRDKKLTLLRTNATTDDHLRRVAKKYSDWKLSAEAKAILNPVLPPPPRRYSGYY